MPSAGGVAIGGEEMGLCEIYVISVAIGDGLGGGFAVEFRAWVLFLVAWVIFFPFIGEKQPHINF